MKAILVVTAILAMVLFCQGVCPPDPKCPEVMGAQPELHPVPSDCTKYIMCDNGGVAHYKKCPPGLIYNPTQHVCDWPDSYKCTACEK